MQKIADYFAAQQVPYSRSPLPPVSAATLQRGEQLASQGDPAHEIPACQSCHGSQLTGVQPSTPGLIDLPYEYISSHLGSWRTHTRATVAPDCMAVVAIGWAHPTSLPWRHDWPVASFPPPRARRPPVRSSRRCRAVCWAPVEISHEMVAAPAAGGRGTAPRRLAVSQRSRESADHAGDEQGQCGHAARSGADRARQISHNAGRLHRLPYRAGRPAIRRRPLAGHTVWQHPRAQYHAELRHRLGPLELRGFLAGAACRQGSSRQVAVPGVFLHLVYQGDA